jgi:hypothetical protein
MDVVIQRKSLRALSVAISALYGQAADARNIAAMETQQTARLAALSRSLKRRRRSDLHQSACRPLMHLALPSRAPWLWH